MNASQILSSQVPGCRRPPARGGFAPGIPAAALLLCGAYGMGGQPAQPPAFQVASVKPNTDTAFRGMGIRAQPGGRLTAQNAPLLMLIQNAYAVQAYQVVGGPAWINSDGYDIEAKPEGTADRKQMWAMLQTLTLHRDTRELPVYALTVIKSGLKQVPPREGGCVVPAPDAPPRAPGAVAPPCGNVGVMMSPTGIRMEGSKVPMAELIRTLAMVMGRPVLDRTGVTGEFEVRMEFTPDETTAGLPGSRGPGDPGGAPLPTDTSRPTISAALQEQLGLKLAPAKAPVEVLVIDHVERPTAN
jgi:uncharacterized protein (TIGR03435 family)